MKIAKMILCLAISLMPVSAFAQGFEANDDCLSFKRDVQATQPELDSLESLFQREAISQSQYNADLYEGVKVLSRLGEIFFKASELYEVKCRTGLLEAGDRESLVKLYDDWYLSPISAAHGFFKRAREAAIFLGLQSDVDSISKSIQEFESAVLAVSKLCEKDLADTAKVEHCKELSLRLAEAMK